jgi:uncharacterized protein
MANKSTGLVRGAIGRFAMILRKRLKKAPKRKRSKVVGTQVVFPYLAGIAFAAGLALWAAWQFEIKQPDHSALLQARGVVSWHTLVKVSYTRLNDKLALHFDNGINALDGKTVKLRGFVTPLASARDQRHFILSSKPPTCPYCLPAGPDEMVEVFCKHPIKYSFDPITVSGQFKLLHDDDSGLYYRMLDAEPVSLDS